jgi:LacI family transcriptional regulator
MGFRHIGIILDPAMGYDREVIYGFQQFLGADKPWIANMATPPYNEANSRAAMEWMKEWKVEGVIARVDQPAFADMLVASKHCVVNAASVLERKGLAQVCEDNEAVGRLAAEHLLDRNFRYFACLVHSDHISSVRRRRGFVNVAQSKGIEPACPDGWMDDATLSAWLKGLPKPLGLYTDTDPVAIRVTRICRESGIRIPDQVALVSNDNDQLICDFARPTISSVDMNAQRIGFEAGMLLERMLNGEAPPAEPVFIPPKGVVTRRSTDALAIDDPDVAAAARFIREHAAEPIGVRDVLDEVPTSRRWLEKRFRRVVGHSLLDEIRRVRVNRAKDLLVMTDFPMPEVARRCGFQSAVRLSTVFHALEGTTPMAHRRRSRVQA